MFTKRLLAVLFLIFLPLHLSASVYAEMLAKNVEVLNENAVEAKGDVVILSPEYTLKADRAIYYKDTGDIELFGTVNMIKGSDVYALADYVKINLNKDTADFNKLLSVNQKSQIWIKSNNATYAKGIYSLNQKSLTSSCDVKDPAWSIGFSKGTYDTSKKWVTLKNSVFYIRSVPVMYFPYFAYSTNKNRSTGLLTPHTGYNKSQGVFYTQSLFIAPAKNYDLELTPQIRTKRGQGIYGTFRFHDSNVSHGFVRAGVFKDKKSYQDDNNLKYARHDGFELGYERTKLFSTKNHQDGLYLDVKSMKDIDYLNLQTDNEYGDVPRLITSRANYFYKKDKDYFGLYAKYYQDTSKDNNDDTLQTLPSLQYHRFITPILGDNLYYALDARWINHSRKEGLRARQFEFDAPLSLTFPLLEEYLQFTATENMYYTQIDYNTFAGVSYENGKYSRNYHTFSLNSDLARMYESTFHTINVSLDYIIPSAEDKRGHFADFISLNTAFKSIKGSIEQHFYTPGGDEFLYHRLSQTRFLTDEKYKLGETENEITFTFDKHISVTNRVLYSHEFSKFSLINTYASYNADPYYVRLSHYFKDDSIVTPTENIGLRATVNLSGKTKLHASINYDNELNFTKSWAFGWTYGKRCWDYTIMFKEDTIPVLATSGTTQSLHDKSVMVEFHFHPIGSFVQKINVGTASQDVPQ